MAGETIPCDRVAGCAGASLYETHAHNCLQQNDAETHPPSEREIVREDGGVLQSSEDEGHNELNAPDTEAVRAAIAARLANLRASSSSLLSKPLSHLNTEASNHHKNGDYVGSVAIYRALFARAAAQNLTHPELYICHNNCSAAYFRLRLYNEALEHAACGARLAEASLRRNLKGSVQYIKSFVRKGEALLALHRHREAVSTFEKGLELDPLNPDLKYGLHRANQAVLKDIVQGRSTEHRAITFPEPAQRITYHPYSAPLHKVRTEDMLPLRLLTPFQAENDHNIKDTYNFMTVQSDIRIPSRVQRTLEDSHRTAAWRKAVEGAVTAIEATDTDCRVLNMGSGAGVMAALALRAGARHVTATERWLYLALATKETLVENGFDDDMYNVVYKRPTDLRIKEDVPVCANLVIADFFDQALLTSGIVPAIRHALDTLTTSDATVLPGSATVFIQAVELRTSNVCGFDMSAANLYRWHPTFATGAPLDMEAMRPLSRPAEVWYFDFKSPADKSDVKTMDIEFTETGRWNAVLVWYTLHLWGDVYITSAPVWKERHEVEEGGLAIVSQAESKVRQARSMQPALQYLAGELRVDPGTVYPVTASHNTVGMRFDIETADYLHLMKPDMSFSHRHFNMLADTSRLEAYDRAIRRAVAQRAATDGEVHALDIGTGSGILALMAARAGARSVVACDLHDSLCDVARKAAAAAKGDVGKRVSVVHRDAALLQRGKEVRPLGVNLVVADMFDAGLLGDQFPYLLELTRKKVIQPGATVIPSAATLYCMGIEALTGNVEGVSVASFNKYRWDANYSAVRLSEVPHKRLTAPARVTELFFDGEQRARNRDGLIKLDVIESGILNGVVFWFDLHLDDVDTITSAPDGIGQGGLVMPLTPEEGEPRSGHYWGQALQYLDRAVRVHSDSKVTLLAKREGSKMRFSLRPGVGDWVGKAPWKVEWGGGASVENPHFQRVHYCELLVRDFLMRCRSRRFPSIQKDVNMVLAHCGSLFLDPEFVQESGHELVVLERLHAFPEFSPGASLEALTRRPLRLC